MAEYFTILTLVGKGLVAESIASGTPINLTQLAVGDGDYTPNEGQTSLVSEKWRDSINQIYWPEGNPDWVIIEAVIPPEDGGWYVREVGVFDNNGDLFAIGKYPESYKPTLPEGSGKDLYIRMVLQVSNDAEVTLQIDPSVVLSTRKYVDDSLAALGIGHRYEHNQEVEADEWNITHSLSRDTIPIARAYREVPPRNPVSCGDGTYCGEAYCGQSIDYTSYRDLFCVDTRKISANQIKLVFLEAVSGKAVLLL